MKGLEFVRPNAITLAIDLEADDGIDIGLNNGGVSVWDWFTVIIVLVLIVALILLLVRFMAYKNNSWSQARSLRQLGGVGVGQNKSIQLVKVGSAIYVVGVGDNVQILDKIEDDSEIAHIMESLHTAPSIPGSHMLAKLQNWTDARRKLTASKDESTSPEAESFQELFHSKLQQVGNRRENLKELLQEDRKTDGERHE